MYLRPSSRSLRPILSLVAGVSALMWTGLAQAACLAEQQQLPAQTVSAFLANPGQIIQQFPNGGGQMITQVRDLVASNPAALPAIIALLANANPDQKSAIGSGLGQASRLCLRADREFATQIQQAVARANDQAVVVAFAAVTGDQPLGGVGGGPLGGGGGGGGIGGQANSLPGGPSSTGPAQVFGGNSHNTGQFSYSSTVGGGGSSSTTSTTTTISGSVSP